MFYFVLQKEKKFGKAFDKTTNNDTTRFMKKFIYSLIILFACTEIQAQDYVITGKVADKSNGQPVEMAAVRVMKKDSTFVTGASANLEGAFKISMKKEGDYILKISFLGYVPAYKNVTISKQNPSVSVGTISLLTNDRMIDEATVKAKVAKLEMRGDTFVYNVAAYRVPEGATLEALIDKLPGAEVDDDGGIKLNGKNVSEIRVDGKDFFKGDTKVAMKNLPVSLIDKVKAYDMQSDYTKETGIDDGNEKTVLDLMMKQKLKSTWFSNIDLAYGNHDRYSGNLFVNRFNDVSRISAFANANNVNDRRFRGGGPGFRGGGGGGLTANKNFGFDGFWNNGKKEEEGGFLELNGNMRYGHSSSERESRSNSETFLNTGNSSSFNNSESHNFNHNTNYNMALRVRWKPDSMTTIYARPEYNHSEGRSNGDSKSATFNADPYQFSTSPLDSMFFSNTAINVPVNLATISVNKNIRQSLSDNKNDNARLDAGVTRRLSKKGRSVGLDITYSTQSSKNHSFNISDIYYFQNQKRTYNNQYTTSPTKNSEYAARVSYSEPIIKNVFFQGSYFYSYNFNDRDHSLYQLDSLATWGIDNIHTIGMLPEGDSLNLVLNMVNSQYATYRDYTHRANLGFRWVNDKVNFSIGVNLQPQHTKLDYKKNQLDTTVTRDVFNVAPNVRLRYTFSKYSKLELRYRGSSSQPSMTDLLDITDTSDPLNVSMGNPGLKPSWSNNFNVNYNNYWTEYQRSIYTYGGFSQTSNSISNAVVYDETTGKRTSRPENINGNWNTWAGFGMNTAFGSDKSFNFGTNTDGGFNHRVGYISTGNTSSQKNTMKTFNIGERIRTSYRTDFYEIGINGSVNYDHSRSELQAQNNLDTWTFAYGGSLQFNTTWNMSLSTDIAMNSRRGFNDESMNTNELIWNVQLAQSFFKNNAGTLSIQFYDLLHQQSNISRTINSLSRSDTWSNGINSFFMVHFIYRLNIFGGMNGRIGGGGGGGMGGPGRGMGGGGFGGRGGRG